MQPLASLSYSDSEVVLGLVAPVGTDLDSFQRELARQLGTFGYLTNPLRLSRFLEEVKTPGVRLRSGSEYDRISSRMDAGNAIRKVAKRGDVLAIYGVHKIREKRDKSSPPLVRTVHILNSLKHPGEVTVLRRIYGPGFFLIGLYSPETERLEYLRRRKKLTAEQASTLVKRDQKEEDKWGQQTRDAFQLADVFLSLKDSKAQLKRFLDLVFSHPYTTPTLDEHAMFLAHAASLRSGSLARQVGAVVVSSRGEVVATGANDVPRFGGGLYWPGKDDARDHNWEGGVDSNDEQIREIALDTIKRVVKSRSRPAQRELISRLAGGRLFDLTEFGRAAHAEMEALISCARTGVSPRDGTLYTTTFPCHNCAKHIVTAGITRVHYVEPYPKSMALELHNDSITLDERETGKVQFVPFLGVAARRYFDLFSTCLGTGSPMTRKENGRIVDWEEMGAEPRVQMSPASYIEREVLAINEVLQSRAMKRIRRMA